MMNLLYFFYKIFSNRILKTSAFVACGFAVALFLLPNAISAKKYTLYILAGQSNMTGHGYVNELPLKYKKPFKNVMIFEGNTTLDYKKDKGLGIWAELQPGHGEGFKSDGKSNFYSNRFGLELSFGKRIAELKKGENIALIKYSRNGSSIDASSAGIFGCWEPDFRDSNGINQYDHFLATLRNALAVKDIDGDGEEDILITAGVIWMQGESDATNTYAVAKRYSANLKKLMNLIRASLRYDNLPIAIGRISDSKQGDNENGNVWKYGDIIRYEQEYFVENDLNAVLITSTDNYGYSDKWHYNSQGYIDLGIKFAEAIYKLPSKSKP